MEYLKNLTTLPSKGIWLEGPELPILGICYGFLTEEDTNDLKAQFEAFLGELEALWPSSRLKDWQLGQLRDKYRQIATNIQNLERDNKDQRSKGVSYQNRKIISDKIKFGAKIIHELKKEAQKVKSATFTVKQIVQPSDWPVVLKKGLEPILKIHFLSPSLLSVKDLT